MIILYNWKWLNVLCQQRLNLLSGIILSKCFAAYVLLTNNNLMKLVSSVVNPVAATAVLSTLCLQKAFNDYAQLF